MSTEPTDISSRLSAYFGTDLGLNLRMPVWRLVDRIKQLRPGWPENEQPRFDPGQLTRVTTIEDIRALPQSTEGLFVYRLEDAKLAAIAGHLPALRQLIADGSTRVTDSGLQALADMHRLECLDLEWSGVTDRGLLLLASIPSLQWIDIGFCEGVSARGVAELRRLRPDLEVVETAG